MIYQEPPPGCIITWLARYRAGGRQYQYAAVHVAGRGWYTTDTIHANPITWPQLKTRIGGSPCFVATGWATVEHVIEGETITFALPGGEGGARA